MATTPAAPLVVDAPKVALAKRDPVMIGGAILGILESVVFYIGEAGLELPVWVTMGLGAIIAIAGAFGIRATTRPAALSVPASEKVAKAARDAKTTIGGIPAPVIPDNQAGAVQAAAAAAKARLGR